MFIDVYAQVVPNVDAQVWPVLDWGTALHTHKTIPELKTAVKPGGLLAAYMNAVDKEGAPERKSVVVRISCCSGSPTS